MLLVKSLNLNCNTMAQSNPLRYVLGLSLVVAMFAYFFGASPLKAFTSTVQRTGTDWSATKKNASVPAVVRVPVYFFSHGGVSEGLP